MILHNLTMVINNVPSLEVRKFHKHFRFGIFSSTIRDVIYVQDGELLLACTTRELKIRCFTTNNYYFLIIWKNIKLGLCYFNPIMFEVYNYTMFRKLRGILDILFSLKTA
jgi:hypothetical protein